MFKSLPLLRTFDIKGRIKRVLNKISVFRDEIFYLLGALILNNISNYSCFLTYLIFELRVLVNITNGRQEITSRRWYGNKQFEITFLFIAYCYVYILE